MGLTVMEVTMGCRIAGQEKALVWGFLALLFLSSISSNGRTISEKDGEETIGHPKVANIIWTGSLKRSWKGRTPPGLANQPTSRSRLLKS